jgi:hypothetical protein
MHFTGIGLNGGFVLSPSTVNIAVEWSALPLYIQEVLGSDCTWRIPILTEIFAVLLGPGK